MVIKKISSQLKKRVKLPSCKIIKIYESYRALIKRIADALKKSMKSQNKVNSSSSENNIITENVAENKPENKEENKDNMAMDIENPICDKNETEEINLNKIAEEKKEKEEELNKMDIEMEDKTDKVSSPLINKGIQTEVKKESNENNELKTFTYQQKQCLISSQKKIRRR